MNEIDIMEQNLARLLSEHLSHPSLDSTEPADPFQKRTFGKKLRKSAVSMAEEHRTASLPKLQALGVRSMAQLEGSLEGECDAEAEMYLREVEVLMARLRVGVERVEESCRARVQRICASSSGRQRQQRAESLLGEMEASIDFVVNDCFSFEGRPARDKENRHERDNGDARQMRDCKQERQARDCRPEREARKGSTANSRARPAERHEKSIYESVLQQRKLRRSKKRMI